MDVIKQVWRQYQNTYNSISWLSINLTSVVPVVQNAPWAIAIALILCHHDIAEAEITVIDLPEMICGGDC